MKSQSVKAVLCHAGLMVSLFLCLMLVCSAAEGRLPAFSAVVFGLLLLAGANLICGVLQPQNKPKRAEKSADAAAAPRPQIRVVSGEYAA